MAPPPDTTSPDLTAVTEHFAFGENWARYAQRITEAEIQAAETALLRLVHRDELQGRSFLDIGCGSGLHSLAALRLGARRVVATDLDPKSVETTRAVLRRFAPVDRWEAREISVFDLTPAAHGTFDIVYSWGVLHHTGAMYDAIEKAAALVAPGGLLVLALYSKTPCCGFWRVEKRFYAHAPAWVQRVIRGIYVTLYRLRSLLARKSFREHVASYRQTRGMDFHHDVHDWLGGYPYESITPDEAHATFDRLGFAPVREFVLPRTFGLFGSGCHEFVVRSRAVADAGRVAS